MNKYIAEYLRLSDDDGNSGESGSIASQRQIVESYISTVPDFSGMPVKEFIDDGYSGTNFDRPGVKLLLEAVRGGEVSCIIVKDLSRFGRQYLEVSKFIEQLFPYLGIRFIAVNDHYDSNNHKGATADIDVPVRNMINAMYSKDISKKVKSAKRTQMKQGIFSNAFAPYGYMKSKNDRHILLIDEPAAEIVRRIFELAGEGHSAFQIADMLNAEGVLSPAAYKKQNGSKLAVSNTARSFWTNGIISRILRDERYTGVLVGGQRETTAVGSGKKRHTPRESWVRVPGVLPVITPREVFEALAAKRQRFAVPAKPNTNRALYKKVRCGYCGFVCQYLGDAPKPYYLCDTARYTDRHGCKRERIRENEIIGTVRAALHSQIMALPDLEKLCRDSKKSQQKDACAAEVTAERLDIEIKRLQAFKRQLYERYKSGALDKTSFLCEREKVYADINAKTTERDTLLAGTGEQEDVLNSAQQLLSSFKKYQAPAELPDDVINELVEAVYIYDTDRIEVKFSFGDEMERAIIALEDMA
ncbi:MAG: recombinase family protein [Oscillospiraceae bacterium]|jgi:DNA invertase Pin-like site-specific DNA recombinase|nr:recombinase family protein [Oscillospiraceae bacterium]